MNGLRRAALDLVYRYRASKRHAHRGHCRFTPSCSTYAIDALEQRALPIALLAIAWRIVRCNPLVRLGTHDPVHRSAAGARPNSVRTVSAALLIGSAITIGMSGAAFAQGVSGGCAGTVGGSPPEKLTSTSPLVVGKGENVRLAGTSPQAGGQTVVDYTILLIAGIAEVDARTELHGSGRNWTGTVNVDDYLKYGSGKYRIEGTVTTVDGAYECPVSFYVKLDGSKVVAGVAALFAAAGAVGMTRAGKATEPPAPEPPSASPRSPEERGLDELEFEAKAESKANAAATGTALGCVIGAMAFIAGFMGDSLDLKMIPFLTGASAATPRSSRIWVKGKPVLGFFSGLFFGLGLAVLTQQLGYVTLNPVTAIVFPLFAAIVGAWRGWRGSAFARTEIPPPPPDI